MNCQYCDGEYDFNDLRTYTNPDEDEYICATCNDVPSTPCEVVYVDFKTKQIIKRVA